MHLWHIIRNLVRNKINKNTYSNCNVLSNILAALLTTYVMQLNNSFSGIKAVASFFFSLTYISKLVAGTGKVKKLSFAEHVNGMAKAVLVIGLI